MIIYNVTIKVDWLVHDEWLEWMKAVYIPGMLDTGFFDDYRMVRLLQVDETEGPTYAVQYFADSMEQYNMFVEKQSDMQCRIGSKKWDNKMVSFSTLMEVVQ